MIRSATSPRLAIRIFLNMRRSSWVQPGNADPAAETDARPVAWLVGPDREQPLAVLDGLPALDIDVHDFAVVLGVDFVHELHGFDDAEHLPLLHSRADLDKG